MAVYRALATASVGSHPLPADGEGGWEGSLVQAAGSVLQSLVERRAILSWDELRLWTAGENSARNSRPPWDGPCLSVAVSAFPAHAWTLRWPVAWLVPELADVVEVMES